MAHSIWKFRLPADTVVKNDLFGDEPALENILRAASDAGVPKHDIRDRSTAEKIDVDVILDPQLEELVFKLACGVDEPHICKA